MSNQARVWQRSVLALCVVGFLAIAACTWSSFVLNGDIFGGSQPVTESSFVDRVDAVGPASPAERSGIRPGDKIALLRMTPEDRYRERNELQNGRPIRLAIERNGTFRNVTVTPVPYRNVALWTSTIVWLASAFWLGSALTLAVAGFLIARRPESAEVQRLSLTLVLIVLGENLFPANWWLTPWVGIDAAINVIAQFVFSAGIAFLSQYALLFGQPVSRARRFLTAITVVVAFFSSLIWTGAAQASTSSAGLLGIAGLWFGFLDIHAWLASKPAVLFLSVVGPPAVALLCALAAVRASRGSERPRVAWATGSLAILYIFAIAAVQGFVTDDPRIYYFILNLSWFIAPLGLTYALLRRRLLDVGFVLNRAAVFTAVSLLVVGMFTLLEWALGGWLHSANQVTNVAVSATIALALGLSLHQIHSRVDRIVDGIFFRKRNEDESALKKFAREVLFITNETAIVERATETLARHAGASSVAFTFDDGTGRYGAIDENDAALVTLRASHSIVDLHGISTALMGEFAYPMVTRGHVMGVLVLGAKKSGEPYAPDESEAIAQLANGVGIALGQFHESAKAGKNEILDAIDALEHTNRTMVAAINALPDAIAAKLREERTPLIG